MYPRFAHDGIDFAYLDEGSGPALVFQHGLGGDATQARALWAGRGRLVCLECRGHGGTTDVGPPERLGFATFAHDLAALVDALDLGEIVLGGMSMGAGVALRLACERPERIRGLVLVRPAWFTDASPPNLAAFPVIAQHLRRDGLQRGRAAYEATPLHARIAAKSPGTADSMLTQFDRPLAVERSAVLERIPADRPLPDAGPWPQLAMPVLVIGNASDPIHPFACAEAWAAALPNAALRTVTPKSVDEERHAAEVAVAVEEFAAAVRG